jgi:hypothetical protein
VPCTSFSIKTVSFPPAYNIVIRSMRAAQAVWSWGPSVAHTWKIWFDRSDNWASLIENVYRQVGLEWFQGPGQIHNPDMMTIGRGGMTDGEYRVEVRACVRACVRAGGWLSGWVGMCVGVGVGVGLGWGALDV